nr:serine--tRNA ligase [Kitasatospora sp. SID7827]
MRDLLSPEAVTALARRGYRLDADSLAELAALRSRLVAERDALHAAIRITTRRHRPATQEDAAEGRDLRQRAGDLAAQLREAEQRLRDFLLAVPNTPLECVPPGRADEAAVELRQWGARPEFGFAPRDHVALGAGSGILDLERAGRVSGARFAVLRGAGARLERALASFLLDLHTREHGYVEMSVPHLVTRESMTATGQLPKFADDLFGTRAAERELFLIPTAEVPLVNLFRGETLSSAALPLAVTAHTACFRSEAGSYGRDTRGVIRLHEFAKVELVRLCAAQDARHEHEVLLGHAEEALRRLGLHYRVVELRTGDLGFSARRTYDLEVWLPGQQRYREISSVSDCGTFQGRRAGIKVKTAGANEFAATLNGSGLPIGRTMAALLEQFQREDGSVAVPAALVPHTGFEVIAPDGGVR